MVMRIDLYRPTASALADMEDWLEENEVKFEYDHYIFPGGGPVYTEVGKRVKTSYITINNDEMALLFRLKFGEWV